MTTAIASSVQVVAAVLAWRRMHETADSAARQREGTSKVVRNGVASDITFDREWRR